jgi:hypothetical protein
MGRKAGTSSLARYRAFRIEAVRREWRSWARPLRPTQYYFGTETRPHREFGKRWFVDALERQAADAVKLHEFEGRTWWWFKQQVYVERERLTM